MSLCWAARCVNGLAPFFTPSVGLVSFVAVGAFLSNLIGNGGTNSCWLNGLEWRSTRGLRVHGRSWKCRNQKANCPKKENMQKGLDVIFVEGRRDSSGAQEERQERPGIPACGVPAWPGLAAHVQSTVFPMLPTEYRMSSCICHEIKSQMPNSNTRLRALHIPALVLGPCAWHPAAPNREKGKTRRIRWPLGMSCETGTGRAMCAHAGSGRRYGRHE